MEDIKKLRKGLCKRDHAIVDATFRDYEAMSERERIQRLRLFLQDAQRNPYVVPGSYGLPQTLDERFRRFLFSALDFEDQRGLKAKAHAAHLTPSQTAIILNSQMFLDALKVMLPASATSRLPDVFRSLFKKIGEGDVLAIKLYLETIGLRKGDTPNRNYVISIDDRRGQSSFASRLSDSELADKCQLLGIKTPENFGKHD